MGLPVNIKRVPIFGLGCVAGAAGISRAADYVLAYPKQVAVVLAVELCSLTLQQDDLSIANLISSGLFGDGAGAVLVSGRERESDGPEILATRSVFYPNSEHVMGWDISEKGFRIVLSREVPEVVHGTWLPTWTRFWPMRISRDRHWELDTAHGWSAGAGSYGRSARSKGRCAVRVLGLSAPDRQPVVGLGAGGARRSNDEAPAGRGNIQRIGRDGAGILFRTRSIEVVA